MSWQLWDRVRAYLRRGNVYQADRILQDQSDLQKFIVSGDQIDFSKQDSLLQQTNLQINRLERYKDYDQMDEVGEITLALDLYADEASLRDSEEGHSIVIKAKSNRVKQELESLFHDTLLIDRMIRPMVRYLCKYGDYSAEIVPSRNRDAIHALRFFNIYNFTRVETRTGDLVGFFYQDQLTGGPVFLHPWQVMHLRLTSFENIYHPYGKSVLDGARKDFKRLRLMEDAALIYRITRAPVKRIFSIPVGNIPPREVPQYIEMIARNFKKRRFVDPATGNINERYSPLIQEDDFFLPKRSDGTGPAIDTLPGAENLDQIADIEYFKKKMVAALKIPFSKVGISDQSEDDGRSLASSSPDFAKAIQWIQNEVVIGLKKVAIAHLALKGYSISDIKSFDIRMTAASAIDELYRIETWNSRADVIQRLQATNLFPSEWILSKFTTLTQDEIDEMEDKKQADAEKMAALGAVAGGEPGGVPGELPGLPVPSPGMEGLDEDDKLIVEYNEFIERQRDSDRSKIMNRRNSNLACALDYYLIEGDLDGLPAPGKNGQILLGARISEDERKEVIAETRDLMRQILMEDTKTVEVSKQISE